jgi:chromosome segregation protein
MKLIRLELSGFKSFADSVTITFESGVTAIVGPNGCGKSNVSDGVRWVLGEQSARILRGGKMEDVIFQGSQSRKPVNVAEVSLVLDNSSGTLPIAYREVVITRRLSRSGQSDYLLNGSPVRLRDIQDLLRGTGLGGDAGIVIEGEMIKQLLSDRADERRSLFEEAAGIGLYRDRKHSTERRLAETAADLQRVEDLINEKQSQLRSLARQRGKAERHVKLTEEKFAVALTLAQRHLQRLSDEGETRDARAAELVDLLPAAREALALAEAARGAAAEARSAAEATRTALARRLGEVKVELGRLDGDLKLTAERLLNSGERQRRAQEERAAMQARATAAAEELAGAERDRDEADAALGRVREMVSGRQQEEEALRQVLTQRREAVRRLEQELQQLVARQRTLEGERSSRETDLAQQKERASRATEHRERLRGEQANAERRRDQLVERVGFLGYESRRAKDRLAEARQAVADTREAEAGCRTMRREAEQQLAGLAARRSALEALERDRVGLAPAAAALLSARARFGDGVLGPLSDYVSVASADAELAERLLGDWMHAVLVRDEAAVQAIREWHAEAQPGALVLLPVEPGPSFVGASAYDARLQVTEPAVGWVHAALAGSEALDDTGRVLRRSSGAIFLAGAAPQSGPLRRRAELAELAVAVEGAEASVAAAEAALADVVARLAEADRALTDAQAASNEADRAEREATAQRDDALRTLANLARELGNAEQELERIGKRITDDETRLAEIAEALVEATAEREAKDAALTEGRTALQAAEAEQEAAREQRAQAQVEEAQLAARLRTAGERVARAMQMRTDAERADARLAEELGRLEGELAVLLAQRDEGAAARETIAAELAELEAEASGGEQAYGAAAAALAEADRTLAAARKDADALAEESHRLDLARAEAQGLRTRIVERLEQEWRRPMAELFEGFTPLDLDLESLENEAARIASQLEQIGPVNPLAVEEHAEESKKLDFLVAQRDDLVAARGSLLQAIKEIDGTARQLFLETFETIRTNFKNVFQRMFDGGECELRLSDPENPLDCEIEILGAPRGKRIQHVRLLSMGEKTLVATSLLFGLYLTKPSPFCLMDEVDAPLDDANVGRFTRLLDEFKAQTQFIVITHNPRTMQSADAVYGVTMQEPGISTIVGVRLGEAAA